MTLVYKQKAVHFRYRVDLVTFLPSNFKHPSIILVYPLVKTMSITLSWLKTFPQLIYCQHVVSWIKTLVTLKSRAGCSLYFSKRSLLLSFKLFLLFEQFSPSNHHLPLRERFLFAHCFTAMLLAPLWLVSLAKPWSRLRESIVE